MLSIDPSRTDFCEITENFLDCFFRRIDCEKVQNAVSIMMSINGASINQGKPVILSYARAR